MKLDHSIKQNAELPAFAVTLVDADGVAVDITDATSVTFQMHLIGGTTVISGTATIVDADLGLVRYSWATTDTTVAGTYVATLTANFPASKQQVFPYNGYYLIQVEPDISSDVNDDDITLTFATVAQARAMGYEVAEEELRRAEGIIEVACGRTVEEIADITLGTSDLAILKRATVYQAVWLKANNDAEERTDITKIRTAGLSGESAELTADGIVLAPLARRLLTRLSWVRSRSIRLRRNQVTGLSTSHINGGEIYWRDM